MGPGETPLAGHGGFLENAFFARVGSDGRTRGPLPSARLGSQSG
jgi:hypothetical protein